jgi:hypothetical protein
MTAAHLGFEVDFPHNIYTNNTPTTNMVFRFTPNNNGPFPLLTRPYRGEESSNLSNNNFAQDHHILGVNTDTCQFSEMYQFYPVGNDGGAPTTNSQSGLKYYAMSYNLPDATGGSGSSADAAGLEMQPLALRYSELKAGVIKHAMRFTLNNGNIYSGFLWPATNFTNECGTVASCVPYGSRFRLKASYNIPSTDTTPTKAIKTALKQYGMILADGGTALRIQTRTDVADDTVTWNSVFNEFVNVSSLSQTDFEQVDESSLADSTFSSHVNLSNVYVTPDNYASVVATNISDGVASTVTIALQSVTVGTQNTPYPSNVGALNIMAGTPPISIPYVVEGATAPTTAKCTMVPTIGTLNSNCTYTAPSSQINAISSGVITITPDADPVQVLTLPIIILPSDGIRMRQGPKSSANSPAPTYDANGNLQDSLGKWWWDDLVGNIPNFYESDDQFSPQANWGSATDINLFYTRKFGSGDKVYSAFVPNGNYTLRIGFGTSDPADITASTNTIESQGVILQSSFSVVHQTYTSNILTYPVQVNNNQFYWAIRGNQENSHDMLSNWSLIFQSPFPPYTETLQGNIQLRGGEQLR